jgi:hypothetical protein
MQIMPEADAETYHIDRCCRVSFSYPDAHGYRLASITTRFPLTSPTAPSPPTTAMEPCDSMATVVHRLTMSRTALAVPIQDPRYIERPRQSRNCSAAQPARRVRRPATSSFDENRRKGVADQQHQWRSFGGSTLCSAAATLSLLPRRPCLW